MKIAKSSLLCCQELSRKEQSHRAATVVAAVDRRTFEVIVQLFLLTGAGADVDQFAVGTGSFLDGSPGPINTRLIIVLRQPAAANTALHGEANHAGTGVFVVALRMVDHLVPAARFEILVRFESRHVLLKFSDQLLASRVIVRPVAQGQRDAESGEAVASAPRGFAQGRVPMDAITP